MSSAAAIATYTGRYLPQDARKEAKQVQTPQRRQPARTVQIKPRERQGTEDEAK